MLCKQWYQDTVRITKPLAISQYHCQFRNNSLNDSLNDSRQHSLEHTQILQSNLALRKIFGHHIKFFKVKISLFQTFNQSTIQGIPIEESRENGNFLESILLYFINKKYQLNGPVKITRNSFCIFFHLIVNLVMANISVILVCTHNFSRVPFFC